MLTYDQPRSAGAENALKRARHLLGIRWTPRMELGIQQHLPPGGSYLYALRNGKPAQDAQPVPIPYSSTRMLDGLVGVDISIDTFLSAVQNPASIVYTRNIRDFDDDAFHCTIKNGYFAYGTVCSAFADYVLDLPIHRCTHEWGHSPEFYEKLSPSADSLSLCDTLVTTRPDGHTAGHVRVVTGIARDEQQRVRMVEISEGRTVYPGSRWYPAEEINQVFADGPKRERLFGYRYLDSVRPPEPQMVEDNWDLMLNRGAFSNYHVGERVEFNICCEADTLVIEGDDTHLEIPVNNLAPAFIQGNAYQIYSTADLKAGRYTAYCIRGGRKTSGVYFHVVQLPSVRLTDSRGASFERIALRPAAPDGTPLTKESSCLYAEDGTLQSGIVTFAFSDGKRLIPARAAVREREGEIIVRPAAMLTDAEGKRVRSFKVGEEIVLYALRVQENTVVRASFDGAACCTPVYFTWTEEGVIGYNQRLLAADEAAAGSVDSVVKKYLNDFANFSICCSNEYGRMNTEPIAFVIE